MKDDVSIIGRSNTTVPKEMTDQEIEHKFTVYNSRESWTGSRCYYTFNSSRGTSDFIGYKHNPTGVIFMFVEKRSNSYGSTRLFLDGTETTSLTWPDPAADNYHAGLMGMQSEMNAVDSKMSNWDIVKLDVKSQFVDVFTGFHIIDSNNIMSKGDFGPIMEVVEVLQKGCKVIKQMLQSKQKEQIAQVNKLKEMII